MNDKLQRGRWWRRNPCRIAPWLACALLLLTLPFPVHAEDDASTPVTHFIDLPRQPLASAILSLGEQTGFSIIVDDSLIGSLETTGLRGVYRPQQALAALLGNAPLRARFVDSETIVIVGAPIRRRAVSSVEDDDVITEIQVVGQLLTGSRLRRDSLDSSVATEVIGPRDIELSGAQTTGEVLKFLPSVAGNLTSTLVSNGGNGTATVTLRGLPASNTLVLINGRRTAGGGLRGDSVDLNTIPLSAVERIEVVKDSASAVYGSDAVAGVVNVITADHFDGIEFGSFLGGSSRGDAESGSLSLTFGKQFERSGFVVALHGYENEGIFSRDRSVSRTADDRSKGGIDKRSSATPFARVVTSTDALILRDEPGIDGSLASHFRPSTLEDRYNFREATSALVPSRQRSVYSSAHWQFDGGVQAFAEALVVRTRAKTYLAPTPLFTGFEELTLNVAADQPFNPFGEVVSDVRKRLIDMNSRRFINEAELNRIVAGLRGDENNLGWNIALTWSRNKGREQANNILDGERVQQALMGPAACNAGNGCVPLNLFGPPGAIDDAQVQYIITSTDSRGEAEFTSLTADLTFDIQLTDAGAAEIAVGAEIRHESSEVSPDAQVAAGNTIGASNFSASTGERWITELYSELSIPLITGRRFARQLWLEGALRHSYYSDFGHTSNPRFGVRYRPSNDVLLRMTWAHGFRAPTLDQLHAGEKQSFTQVNDPCSLASNAATLPGCDGQSDPTLVQFLTVFGGSDDLDPESSLSFSAGIVWTPAWMPRFSASIDYFSISQTDVVDASAQFVVDQNAESERFADRVVRDVNGNIRRINATNLNIGEREMKGMDVTLNFSSGATRFGYFDFAVNASNIREFVDQVDPSAEKVNQAGTFQDSAAEGNGSLPKWKTNIGVQWSWRNWEAGYTIHYIDGLREELPIFSERRHIESWTSHDVQVSTFLPWWVDANITLGANNLFDDDPPFASAAFNDSYDTRNYDLTGRYVYMRLVLDL